MLIDWSTSGWKSTEIVCRRMKYVCPCFVSECRTTLFTWSVVLPMLLQKIWSLRDFVVIRNCVASTKSYPAAFSLGVCVKNMLRFTRFILHPSPMLRICYAYVTLGPDPLPHVMLLLRSKIISQKHTTNL